MPQVSELVRYPVKGCAGDSVSDVELTASGLRHDRRFMVTDEDGLFRTQRGSPSLARVRPEITSGGERLTLRAEGVEALHLNVDTGLPRRDVTLHGVNYRGIDQGNAVAEWFSEVIGARSRLVCVPPEHERTTDGLTSGTAAYADSGPLLVVSESTLDSLNARLAVRGEAELPMDRFRPNIVISGWDEPHLEDLARRITIGEAELGYAKLAKRCGVTRVDQETGIKAGPEPIRTLADYRGSSTRTGVFLGSKFAVLRAGKLSLGDEVVVGSWGESEL
ncbi:MOSC domain-containing protein [Actinopolyspora erythraea]|uniref:MOSC domain-containing protein n=1 Tax=Actinopolyspora erythraea TaxID=414996 RepID=A0A099D3C2_9ACTN|nr:MOSC N-terminal beta barrel domain-containing protein [Actinopolyspora erythraea]ASU77473.1 MOSC domain-containing protein [Actinopolyspora erythraea]KGI80312.1 molybdenum cofactor sulfurase [Actinopolyspora erythraea]